MADPNIKISVTTRFLAGHSDPSRSKYAFAYHINIENRSDETVQLISRRWLIIDGNQQQREVEGMGVVGEQPVIEPGSSFSYSSGAILDTTVGTMEGYYHMTTQSGTAFDAPIAPFLLSVPGAVH